MAETTIEGRAAKFLEWCETHGFGLPPIAQSQLLRLMRAVRDAERERCGGTGKQKERDDE